ncbi:MAG: hypothetical protein H7Z14_17600 [Anaerolineae bacterium]|nr:hypothetical protein [Phycisphaerae bacterium]
MIKQACVARAFFFALVVLVNLPRSARAADILIMDSASVTRFDGTTGALKGYFAGIVETPAGFCHDAQGRFCLAGNDIRGAHLEIESVPGQPQFEPFYGGASGITLGPDGSVYGTSNRWSGGPQAVAVVRFEGRTPIPFVTGGAFAPFDIRFGPDGNLYLTQDPYTVHGNSVLRFNGATGEFIDVFASGSGLSGTGGFTFSPDGDLYVTSRMTDSVLRYDGATGAFESAFVTPGSGGLDAPMDVDFGPDGKLYVLGAHGSLRRYDSSDGAYLDTLITNTPTNGGEMFGFVIPEPSSLVFLGMIAFAPLRRARK